MDALLKIDQKVWYWKWHWNNLSNKKSVFISCNS